MRNLHSMLGVFMVLPICLSFVSANIQSVWLAVVAMVLIFILVSVLPFCHKRENLWLFIMVALTSGPINWFLIKKYKLWLYLFPTQNTTGLIFYLSMIQYVLILSSIEEILAGMLGRIIFPRQYKLYIPDDDEYI